MGRSKKQSMVDEGAQMLMRNFTPQARKMNKLATQDGKNANRVYKESRKKGDSFITAVKKSEKVRKISSRNPRKKEK